MIDSNQVNEVLKLVMTLSDSGDDQLSVVARALVVACKAMGVSSEDALAVLAELFDEDMDLTPFEIGVKVDLNQPQGNA